MRKEDSSVREALLKVYRYKCFYTGSPIDHENLHVDHVIPEKYIDMPDELDKILRDLDLPCNFDLNSIYNLVPTKARTNLQKGDHFEPNDARFYLRQVAKNAEKVREEIGKFKGKKNIYKAAETLRHHVMENGGEKAEEFYNFFMDDRDEFECRDTLIEGDIPRYVKSMQNVALEAFLPMYPNLDGSCLLAFRSLKVRNCMISLTHQQILSELFRGLYTDPSFELRGFIAGRDKYRETDYIIQLGNNQFPLPEAEVEQLCKIVDAFSMHYLSVLRKIEAVMGTYYFEKSRSSRYKLLKINRSLWRDIIKFTREFDYEAGISEWHMFDANSSYLKVLTAERDKRYDPGYHVFLYPEQEGDSYDRQLQFPDDELWITWEPQHIWNFRDELSDVSKQRAWNALISYEWLTQELIPNVIYARSRKGISTTIKRWLGLDSFEEFLKKFDIEHYVDSGISRLVTDVGMVKDQESLNEFLSDLQIFYYSTPSERIVVKAEQLQDLYRAAALCLGRTPIKDYHYASSKLRLQLGETPKDAYQVLINYSNTITDGVVSHSLLDDVFRAMTVTVRDNDSNLNEVEIQNIVKSLSWLVERKSLLELIERHV